MGHYDKLGTNTVTFKGEIASSPEEPALLELATSRLDDPVNHPQHYTQYPVEVIQLTEHLNFCRGNAVKYLARAEFKGSELEDLKKARWYVDREIKRLEGKK